MTEGNKRKAELKPIQNGVKRLLPFLLQGSEVLLEGWTDLAQQLYQGVAQEAGVGWLGVKGVRGGPTTHTQSNDKEGK